MKVFSYDEFDMTVLEESFKFKGKKQYSDDKLDRGTSITMPMHIHPIFDSKFLKKTLQLTLYNIVSSPIEYEEIKLYKQTQFFYNNLGGLTFDIEIFGKIHHLITLQKVKYSLNPQDSTFLNGQMKETTSDDVYIFQKYKLLIKLLDICGRLMVKWKIFQSQNYEFRYIGRGLNVKLLDLEKASSTILSPDTFWFVFAVFNKPLCELADVNLFEIAKILKQAAKELFFFILSLNVPIPTYKIKESVAYNSRKYKKFKSDVTPEINIEGFKHQKLRLNRGIFSRCFTSDSALDQLYEKLSDFELAFRNFEKELMVTLLGTSKYVEA